MAKLKRYGLIKIKEGEKATLISKQDKNGWSLGLALGAGNLWFKNARFTSKQEVKRVAGNRVIFFPLKGQK